MNLRGALMLAALSSPSFAYAQLIAPMPGTSSSNQSGGVTASNIEQLNYYSQPPVTEQERAMALERLNLTLADLATYRERPTELGEMTLLETIRTERIARQLYLVLSAFFDPTIIQAKNGRELLAFKRGYSVFKRAEAVRERNSLEYIGKHGPSRYSGSWDPLLRYMILRAYRGSKEAVQSSGLQLFEADWDQAEALYVSFTADDAGGAWLEKHKMVLEQSIITAAQLLEPYQEK